MEGYRDTVKKLTQAGALPDIRSTVQRTALFFAVMSGHVNCVGLLIIAGANKELKDELGKTPLDWALQKKETSRTAEIKERFTAIIELLSKDDETSPPSQFPVTNTMLNSCRNRIRQLLNGSPRYLLFSRKVGMLPLPEDLKNYLQARPKRSSNDARRLHPWSRRLLPEQSLPDPAPQRYPPGHGQTQRTAQPAEWPSHPGHGADQSPTEYL